MPLNAAAKSFPLHRLSFKITNGSFVYLGIHVTNRFENLFKANFSSLLTRTKEDLERWSLLHLSLAARINSIKMNTLPRFLYLFQCLPMFLPNIFFKKGDSLCVYIRMYVCMCICVYFIHYLLFSPCWLDVRIWHILVRDLWCVYTANSLIMRISLYYLVDLLVT